MATMDQASLDATLKRKSDTVSERMPTKQQPVDLELSNDEDVAGKKPGRKPINADLPSNATNSDKRRAQNRAAQRAFRERKERYVKELEERIESLETQFGEPGAGGNDDELRHENEQLRTLIKQLTEENRSLKDGQFTFRPPNTNASPVASTAALPFGHPSPISPTASQSSAQYNPRQLQTPPETTLEDFSTTTSDAFDASTLVLQQLLRSASAVPNGDVSLSLAGSAGQLSQTGIETSSNSTGLDAALYLLGAQPGATGTLANSVLTSTPAALATFADDLIVQDSLDPATATAMHGLLAGQLFPPLAPSSSASASQSPSLPLASDGFGSIIPTSATGVHSTTSATTQSTVLPGNTMPPSSFAALSGDFPGSLFTQYRDPNSLEALLSEPMELPLPGANGLPLNLDELTASSFSAAMNLPLNVIPGMGATSAASTVLPAATSATSISPLMFQDEHQLEKICGSGVLGDADLDFLCSELTTKCRAAKEAAVAKLERLKQEQAEQEKRVARAVLMSTHLDSVGPVTTPPHPSQP